MQFILLFIPLQQTHYNRNNNFLPVLQNKNNNENEMKITKYCKIHEKKYMKRKSCRCSTNFSAQAQTKRLISFFVCVILNISIIKKAKNKFIFPKHSLTNFCCLHSHAQMSTEIERTKNNNKKKKLAQQRQATSQKIRRK